VYVVEAVIILVLLLGEAASRRKSTLAPVVEATEVVS
jgi:hypothetical protein